jgi:hypothetical protein
MGCDRSAAASIISRVMVLGSAMGLSRGFGDWGEGARLEVNRAAAYSTNGRIKQSRLQMK